MKPIKILSSLIAVLSLMSSCCDEDMKNQDATIEANQAPAVQLPAKFSLKASNNMFLVIGVDSVLYATEVDSAKAETFEAIDMGKGKTVLKASTGKYLSDNLGVDSKIDAKRDKASDWEMFEIIKLTETKIQIKGIDGKYVSADLGGSTVLSAIRDKADTWEEFTIVVK